MVSPLIELKDVHKSYLLGKVETKVLRGVSFSLNKGDYVAIMGPSGSGKSTLLHIAGLLDTPTSGKVMFKGKEVSSYDEDKLAEERNKSIGFVFQKYYLIPYMNVLQNVIIPYIVAGGGVARGEKRGRELLAMMDLKGKENNMPNELSGGEQQRVAIARALMNKPEIIIADEPTGNLDSKRGEEIMKIFDELNEQGITILIVTHDKTIAKHAKVIKNIKDGILI